MSNWVNNKTHGHTLNKKIEYIEKNSIPTVFRKDVIQSKNQGKQDKITAINRHIKNVGYNLPYDKKK